MHIESTEHLIAHIEGLQATLTKRNARIAELEQRLADGPTSMEEKYRLHAAYRDGWKDCAGRLMNIVHDHALALREIRKEAFRLYTEGEWLVLPDEAVSNGGEQA